MKFLKLFKKPTSLSHIPDSVFYRMGAVGDITAYDPQGVFARGTKTYLVAKNWATTINAGEPVSKIDFPCNYVVGTPNSQPAVAANVTLLNPPSNSVVGISATASNQISTADGTVTVWPINVGEIWLGNPTTTSPFFGGGAVNSQTAYNSVVGQAVTLQSLAGVWTVNSTHAGANGCIIEYIDITKYPGKVAFSFKPGLSVT